MGSGTVKGKNDTFGNAVRLFRGTLNLWGGNYTNAAGNSNANAVVGTHNVGGHINVYKGATITATGSTPAVNLGQSTSISSVLTIYGGVVDSSSVETFTVQMQGHTTTASKFAKVILVAGEIKSMTGYDIAGFVSTARYGYYEQYGGTATGNVATVSAKTFAKITGGTFNGTLGGDAANVSVTGGTFSNDPSAYVAAGYEAKQEAGKWVVAEKTALSGSTVEAVCEACGETKTFTILETAPAEALTSGHYCIASDMTASISTVSGSKVCLKNDYAVSGTITANGEFNIMGTGAVTMSSGGAGSGAIVAGDASANIHIYGGTYQNGNASRGCVALVNGSQVTVHGGTFMNPITTRSTGSQSTVTIKGGTFSGRGIICIYEAAPICAFNIENGTFNTGNLVVSINGYALNTTTCVVSATGGTFNFDPSGFVAEGYRANASGTTLTVEESSCEKNGHDWLDAGCLTPKTCDVCGETEGAALGHNFVDGECTRCQLEQSEKHPATMGNTLYCDKCKQDVAITSWTALTAGAELSTGHYYLATDIAGQITVAAGATACLHLNGYNVTHDTRAILVDKANSTLSIMGEGNVSAANAGASVNNGAVVINDAATATLNIYGGTYTTSRADRGAVVAGYGTLNIYGGTVNGPIMVKADVVALTISGGTFESSVGIFNGWNLPSSAMNISISGGIFKTDLFVYPEIAAGVTNTVHFNPANLSDSAITGGQFASNPYAHSGMLCADQQANGLWKVSEYDCELLCPIGDSDTLICDACGRLIGDAVPGMTAVVVPGEETLYFENIADAMEAYAGEGYIKLFNGGEVAISGNVTVDINGYAVHFTGTGKLYPMDASNDSYASYGSFTVADGIEIVRDVVNPANGRRYITINDADADYNPFYTTHRVEVTLTNVTFRPSAAGMYYKSEYKCDNTLAGRVSAFGVAVSAVDVPGADFAEVSNDGFSCLTEGFTPDANHAVKATSGALFGLMKEGYTAQINKIRAESKIYANAYFTINVFDSADPSDDYIVMGDITNQGTQNGVGYSLLDLLKYIDSHWAAYAAYQQDVKDFYTTWKATGINWDAEFANIDA